MHTKTFIATCAFVVTCALHNNVDAAPAAAPPPAPGSTLAQVSALVDQYFDAHPALRPVERWRTLNPAPTCSQPGYPRAGLRDEMMGVTVLIFDAGADGRAANVRLKKSSGYAVLDEAAFAALATCELAPDIPGPQLLSYRFFMQ